MDKRKQYKKDWYKKNKERILKKRIENYYFDHEVSKESKRQQYIKNKAGILIQNKLWRDSNKEKIKTRKKIYNQLNKDKRAKRDRERKLTDPLFKLKTNLRTLINQAFKRQGFTKGTKTNIILGCTYEELKTHLENQFKPWMNWENHGKYNGEFNTGWDIDHIIKLSEAKTEEDIIRLNHYTNLQPLCCKINREIKH